jgi:hypothetical protein
VHTQNSDHFRTTKHCRQRTHSVKMQAQLSRTLLSVAASRSPSRVRAATVQDVTFRRCLSRSSTCRGPPRPPEQSLVSSKPSNHKQEGLASPPQQTSRLSKWVHTAKVTLVFYWKGLKQINNERVLVQDLVRRNRQKKESRNKGNLTRDELQLVRRHRMDLKKCGYHLFPFSLSLAKAFNV